MNASKQQVESRNAAVRQVIVATLTGRGLKADLDFEDALVAEVHKSGVVKHGRQAVRERVEAILDSNLARALDWGSDSEAPRRKSVADDMRSESVDFDADFQKPDPVLDAFRITVVDQFARNKPGQATIPTTNAEEFAGPTESPTRWRDGAELLDLADPANLDDAVREFYPAERVSFAKKLLAERDALRGTGADLAPAVPAAGRNNGPLK